MQCTKSPCVSILRLLSYIVYRTLQVQTYQDMKIPQEKNAIGHLVFQTEVKWGRQHTAPALLRRVKPSCKQFTFS